MRCALLMGNDWSLFGLTSTELAGYRVRQGRNAVRQAFSHDELDFRVGGREGLQGTFALAGVAESIEYRSRGSRRLGRDGTREVPGVCLAACESRNDTELSKLGYPVRETGLHSDALFVVSVGWGPHGWLAAKPGRAGAGPGGGDEGVAG